MLQLVSSQRLMLGSKQPSVSMWCWACDVHLAIDISIMKVGLYPVQALTYDVRKSRQREVVAFMQTGSATRIQACVRGWLARRLFSARLAAALLLARCNCC